MKKSILFLSLKWKIAIIMGSLFLILHSLSSYFVYLDASDEFQQNRTKILNRYQKIAQALSKDSFSMLDQVAEVISADLQVDDPDNLGFQVADALDQNWSKWQFIWDLNNAVFINRDTKIVQQWGSPLEVTPRILDMVFKRESPVHQIVCPKQCYQFVIIPVMHKSQLIGALGIGKSFADTVIKYNQVTETDLGVLVSNESSNEKNWPYLISALTNASENMQLLNKIEEQFSFYQFLGRNQQISFQDQIYEVSLFHIRLGLDAHVPAFFIIIDEITDDLNSLNQNLQFIWLYGIGNLLIALGLMLITLLYSFKRITNLSISMPLLAQHRYVEFRRFLNQNMNRLFLHDELDLLNQDALKLADQLETLEMRMNKSFEQLLEHRQQLAKEKDFISQLIQAAPIFIITQNDQGRIASVNQAVANELFMDEQHLVGLNFIDILPEREQEHFKLLQQLRSGERQERVKYEGSVMVNGVKKRFISWIHTRIGSQSEGNSVILSLGMDISERKLIEEQMFNIATHDYLTGINNRRKFHTELDREIAIAQRSGKSMGLLYIDLDQFKAVNDTSGHQAGDQLLIEVTQSLQGIIRETDILSRTGGDEFTLIIPNADSEGIENLAGKINQGLKALNFVVEDKRFKIGASIGIAVFPEHGANAEELLSNADIAMYQAKQMGRGVHHMFSVDDTFQMRLNKRMFWKEMIEEALENDQFVLCYQPIMDLKQNTIGHYECLSRIRTSSGEILMPGDFINYAEDLGLVGKIDRMIVKKVVEQQIKLSEKGQHIKLAVNLSGHSFNDTTIFHDIRQLFDDHDINPASIIFEITETAAVSNFSSAQDLIRRIQDLGCKLALDDFGVGFSSFSYLKHLPVDYVKIDGSFIKQLDQNFEDKVFVKALTEVSQALGKKTVAEFVENEQILHILSEFGIDYVQGYYIGKPGELDL